MIVFYSLFFIAQHPYLLCQYFPVNGQKFITIYYFSTFIFHSMLASNSVNSISVMTYVCISEIGHSQGFKVYFDQISNKFWTIN